MVTELVITSNFNEVAAKFALASADARALMEAGLLLCAEEVRDIAVQAIKRETPAVSGRLRDSTQAELDYGADEASITISQPAESLPNADGSGGGQHYVQWVVGGRGDITASSGGPYATGKRALAGPNFGPVHHVGPAAPNDYPQVAMDAAQDPIRAALDDAGQRIASRVVGLIA